MAKMIKSSEITKVGVVLAEITDYSIMYNSIKSQALMEKLASLIRCLNKITGGMVSDDGVYGCRMEDEDVVRNFLDEYPVEKQYICKMFAGRIFGVKAA